MAALAADSMFCVEGKTKVPSAFWRLAELSPLKSASDESITPNPASGTLVSGGTTCPV